jgi:hypothetical protein
MLIGRMGKSKRSIYQQTRNVLSAFGVSSNQQSRFTKRLVKPDGSRSTILPQPSQRSNRSAGTPFTLSSSLRRFVCPSQNSSHGSDCRLEFSVCYHRRQLLVSPAQRWYAWLSTFKFGTGFVHGHFLDVLDGFALGLSGVGATSEPLLTGTTSTIWSR